MDVLFKNYYCCFGSDGWLVFYPVRRPKLMNPESCGLQGFIVGLSLGIEPMVLYCKKPTWVYWANEVNQAPQRSLLGIAFFVLDDE
jgi:hypothetical protein